MVSVHDVARYFLSLADEEAGDLLSNLKLQKLCYYAQGFRLALSGEPLYQEPIEAWTHGPVIPELYHAYKHHGSGAIELPTGFDVSILPADVRELLDEVYEVYGQYSAWKLRNMTHDEAPWMQAYQRGPSSVISTASLQEFFKTLVV
jgi:uncharacterized phage-associated protein